MILSLKIENFRSIREELVLDMRAGKRLSEDRLPDNIFVEGNTELLKSLMIYGRNASGKSNVLMALDTIVDLVNESDRYKHNEKIDHYQPFLFDSKSKKEVVKFEIEFVSFENKVHYIYSLAFNKEKFVYESLYFFPEGKKAKLFERNQEKISYGEHYKGVKKRIENDLLPNQLFLSKSASNRIKYLDDVYLYFKEEIFISIFDDFEYDKSIAKFYTKAVKGDKQLREVFLKLLQAADTNIIDFRIFENKNEVKFPENWSENKRQRVFNSIQDEIYTYHLLFKDGKEIGKSPLSLENESVGTKKLFVIGYIIAEALLEGGVLVIDELDKGFHPLLSKMIIQLFNSKKNNPKNAQLIFATHDSALLDLDLLRRDQIGFVDKEHEGNSIFYKLSDIKGVRKDTPIDKWYLSGRFGAIPVLGDVNFNYCE